MQKKQIGCIDMIYENETYQATLEKILQYIPDEKSSFLITGATGLIGSFLVDLLHYSNQRGQKHKVYALSRSLKKLNDRFPYNDTFIHYIQQDVRLPFYDIPAAGYTIHAASNANPRLYVQYPAETLLTNIEGTKNALEYCKMNNSTFLLTSTFEVYGNIEGRDIYDEDSFGIVDANEIRSCYPESKRSAEILTRCCIEEYGIKGYITRLCSIYGPTMLISDNKAHAQFIRNGLHKENIVLKSKGTQIRTYMYVADTVSAILTVLAKGKNGEAYNISNENSIATIADVAKTVAKISGTKVVFETPDEEESKFYSKSQNCVLDNSKLRKIGWKGAYTLEEGLRETLTILR